MSPSSRTVLLLPLLPLLYLLPLLGTAATATPVVTGWRGNGCGVFPNTQPPLHWSAQSNVLWRTALPQWSNASPLVLDDLVFVGAEPATLVCLSLADGSIQWQHALEPADLAETPAEAETIRANERQAAEQGRHLREAEKQARKARETAQKSPTNTVLAAAAATAEVALAEVRKAYEPLKAFARPETHGVNGYTSPSPVSDGQDVFFLTGLGTAARFQRDGTRVWARTIGRSKHGWGHSASPLLAGDLLLVHIGDTIYAVKAATGEPSWQASSRSGWGSPALARAGDVPVVVTPSGDWLAVADGRKLAGGTFNCNWNGPVVDDTTLYVVDEGVACAIPLPAAADAIPASMWTSKEPKDRHYATTLVFDGLIYNINQRGRLSVFDAADGKIVYQQDLDLGKGGKTVYPSPICDGKRIYISADNGVTVVVAPGRSFTELARNQLPPFRTTPVCVGHRLLIRTQEGLFCLGSSR